MGALGCQGPPPYKLMWASACAREDGVTHPRPCSSWTLLSLIPGAGAWARGQLVGDSWWHWLCVTVTRPSRSPGCTGLEEMGWSPVWGSGGLGSPEASVAHGFVP